MRSTLHLWVPVLLVACAGGPFGKAASDGKLVVKSADDGSITMTEGSYHCTGDHPNNPMQLPNCKEGIPVIVMLKDDGTCLSLVPYYELVIHPARIGDTDVVWKLYGPKPYEFDVGDGIRLKPKKNSATPPTNNYRDKSRVAGDRFRVRLIGGAPAATFQHDALVKGPSGMCTPIDPLITNKG